MGVGIEPEYYNIAVVCVWVFVKIQRRYDSYSWLLCDVQNKVRLQQL
jgi:hypothetical protein